MSGEETDLTGILRDAPVPILVAGPDSKILFANSKAKLLLGHYLGNAPRGTPYDATHYDLSANDLILPAGTPDRRVGLVDADGHSFEVELTAAPGTYLGQPVSIIAIREIPQQGDGASNEVAQAEGSADDHRRRLRFAIASHEFRVPLGIIDSAAQRLARILAPDGNEDAAHRIRQIRRSVKGMLRLIEDTIDSIDDDLSTRVLRRQETDLGAILSQICEDQAELFGNRHIVCSLGPLPLACIDPALIERVFINLLSNAIKFSPEAFPIQVDATHDAAYFIVDVADQGIGIPEAELDHVFDERFRASNADHAPGSGLGLGIARRLVEAHQGKMEIRSTPGLGTVVSVRLPIVTPTD